MNSNNNGLLDYFPQNKDFYPHNESAVETPQQINSHLSLTGRAVALAGGSLGGVSTRLRFRRNCSCSALFKRVSQQSSYACASLTARGRRQVLLLLINASALPRTINKWPYRYMLSARINRDVCIFICICARECGANRSPNEPHEPAETFWYLQQRRAVFQQQISSACTPDA